MLLVVHRAAQTRRAAAWRGEIDCLFSDRASPARTPRDGTCTPAHVIRSSIAPQCSSDRASTRCNARAPSSGQSAATTYVVDLIRFHELRHNAAVCLDQASYRPCCITISKTSETEVSGCEQSSLRKAVTKAMQSRDVPDPVPHRETAVAANSMIDRLVSPTNEVSAKS